MKTEVADRDSNLRTLGTRRPESGLTPHARARKSGTPVQEKSLKVKAIAVSDFSKVSFAGWLLEASYVVFERLLAAAGLILGFPIILLQAIAIRLDSKGPVLFRHVRAGQSVPLVGRDLILDSDVQPPKGGFQPDQLYWVPRSFRFIKLRTMRQDALELFPELYWWNYDVSDEDFENIYHNLDDDPRVTRVGKILRKTSLDEIVNLWHVLTGECRLVGPRPEIMDILPNYTEDEMRKFTVKPGITCLWAIRGRSDLTVREKNQHDLEYVRTRTVWLDLKILVLTVWYVVCRRGAF